MATQRLPASFVPDEQQLSVALPASFVPDSPALPPLPASFVPEEAPPNNTAPVPKVLMDSDFEELGRKHGVDPRELKEIAPYYDVTVAPTSVGEAVQQGGKAVAGFAGRSIGMGIPQFAYKKAQEPRMRAAIDELGEIASNQKSTFEKIASTAGEIVAPGGVIGAGAKSTAGRVAGSVATGGTYGLAGSKEGEELKGAVTGAAIGGALGGGTELLGAALNRMKANALEKSLAEGHTKSFQFDVGKGADEIATRTTKSEETIEDLAFRGKEALSKEEINSLVKEQIGDESLARYLDPAADEGRLIRSRIDGPVTEERIKQALSDSIVETRIQEFAADLTRGRSKSAEEALEQIQEVASRQGAEATQARYKDFVKERQADRYITENSLRDSTDPGFFGRALNTISDNQFVLQNIDNKFGTSTAEVLSRLSRDYNRSTFALKEFREKYNDIFKAARKNGTDSEVVNSDRIYQALDTGQASGLTAEELATAGSFQTYFRDILGFVNAAVKEKDPRIAPMSIPARADYVPHMLKATPELVSTIDKKVANALGELSESLGRKLTDFRDLKPAEFRGVGTNNTVQELIQAVKLFDNAEIKNGTDLYNRIQEAFFTRNGRSAIETRANAAIERTGEIPEFMLEKNLYKLARRYTDNTLRHLYLRNGIDKLGYQANTLEKLGAKQDATHIRNTIADIMGTRRGTAAEAMGTLKAGMARKLDGMIDEYGRDSVRGHMLSTVKSLPDYFNYWSRQIYPNTLGWFNVRAAIQNATGALTKVAPELGGTYGAETFARGGVYTLANMSRLMQKSKELGILPAEFTRKGEQAIAEGISRTAGARMATDALEAAGKAGMVLYQGVESVNRAYVLGLGELMAKDLAAGHTGALKSLRKFPPNIQKQVRKAAGSPETVAEILGTHLNDVTQYNYNKMSMSEFGRSMGPFFSAFSKWPTATAGDIIYQMRTHGVLGSIPRNMEKYLAPWLLLQGIDYAMGERLGDPDSLTPIQKKLVGTYGLSQSAPIGSLGGMLKGEIFTPPAVDAVMQTFISPAMEGSPANMSKGAASSAEKFVPTAGLVRFLADDLVTYATGRRPEGNLFEKAESAVHRLSR